MADGILRKKIQDRGLDMKVDSAGTAAYHVGEAPDRRMRRTGIDNNVPIDDLRARQFVVQDFDRFDVIFAMDKSNYNNILSLARDEDDVQKVKMMLNESNPGQNLEVPDPYYGGDEGFQNVYNMLDIAVDAFLERVNG